MKVRSLFQTKSIRYLLKVVFTVLILSFAVTSSVSLLYLHNTSREYDRQIENIEFASQVSQVVKEDIARENWYLVAGRATLEESRQLAVLESIEQGLGTLYENAAAGAGGEYIEAAIRGCGTLRRYVEQLRAAVAARENVNDALDSMDDANQVAENIYEALQEFIYAQTAAIGQANQQTQRVTRWMLLVIGLLSLLVIAVAMLAYRTLKRAVDRPGVELAAMADRVLRGDLETQVPPPGLAELNRLTDGINLMNARIRALLDERLLEQQNLQKAEIRALQAQITPHFLYNTLDTIVWLAEGGYNERVVEVTMAFSHFYRVMLSSGRDFIEVREEVEHVRDYLTIQSVRYQDILRYELDVEEAIGGRRMLKLLLQPLVENALYHGIKNKRRSGYIRVTGRAEPEGGMCFVVEDNGIGMHEEQVARLRAALRADAPPEGMGYGLYNVNRRIRLYYGAADLLIKSEYGKGTQIAFSLPRREAEEWIQESG